MTKNSTDNSKAPTINITRLASIHSIIDPTLRPSVKFKKISAEPKSHQVVGILFIQQHAAKQNNEPLAKKK
jgi:hypothetical protein